MLLIDKVKDDYKKAWFYVCETVENGWSRNMLLNGLGTDLYERQGHALTNFKRTLPEETSGLAQELTKDPYDFAFTGITGPYNERLLKDKLLGNITQFLVELGTGFGYLGKEYRIQVGEREQFIDLLFYNLNLSCYVVVEVKIGKFEFADIGQLGGYVVACNHILRKEGRDNPTIGLFICKEKDRVQAQYALESLSPKASLIAMRVLALTPPEKVMCMQYPLSSSKTSVIWLWGAFLRFLGYARDDNLSARDDKTKGCASLRTPSYNNL